MANYLDFKAHCDVRHEIAIELGFETDTDQIVSKVQYMLTVHLSKKKRVMRLFQLQEI